MAHFPIGIYSIPEISMVGETEHELTGRKVPLKQVRLAMGRSRWATSATTAAC